MNKSILFIRNRDNFYFCFLKWEIDGTQEVSILENLIKLKILFKKIRIID